MNADRCHLAEYSSGFRASRLAVNYRRSRGLSDRLQANGQDAIILIHADRLDRLNATFLNDSFHGL
jgi:hypothetical protein